MSKSNRLLWELLDSPSMDDFFQLLFPGGAELIKSSQSQGQRFAHSLNIKVAPVPDDRTFLPEARVPEKLLGYLRTFNDELVCRISHEVQ